MNATRPILLLAAITLLALRPALAADAPPTTRPALPGDDIDLRSACAVAGWVVVGEAERIDPERYMSALDGKYASSQLIVDKVLKGPKGELPDVWLPMPSDKRPSVLLPQKKTRYVFFLWPEEGQQPRAIKMLPETPELARQVAAIVADQAAARPRKQAEDKAGGLVARVVIAAGQKPEGGALAASLRLTNRNPAPLRLCTKGGEWHSSGAAVHEVTLTPGRYKSDSPPAYEFARHVIELGPGASADLPIHFTLQAGDKAARLSAEYEVDDAMAALLDVWAGSARADAVEWPPQS